MSHSVAAVHGEGRSLFYVVNDDAPEGSQPAIVSTHATRGEAEAEVRRLRPVTRADVEGIARTIADVWFKDQLRSLSSTFYLYWRKPRAGERIAIPVLSTEHDATSLTEHTRGMRVSIAWTANEAQRRIAEWLWTLPILGDVEG